jgi:hypothetical protein
MPNSIANLAIQTAKQLAVALDCPCATASSAPAWRLAAGLPKRVIWVRQISSEPLNYNDLRPMD